MIEKIDRYEIHEQLGQGGMAQVYRGYDPHFERYVAVKVLHGHLLTDPESENRFTREARTIAQLEGDAIVPVYDFGRFENTAFIVMRLMKGGTLQEKMTGSPLPMEFINQVIRRICSALERAHSHQVIHRDLKPANILFDDDGMSYLADFGIARMTEGTQTTSIIGTANYMAPEQAQGKPLDGRTDIYQLAVILFEMLTGHQPYEGETTASVLYQHVYEPIPRLISYAGVQNSRFQVLIDNAMAKEMEQRPVSANEFFDLFKMAAAEIDNLQPGAATLVDPLVTRQQPFRETLDDPTVADPPTEKMLISPPELTTADPVFSDRSPAPAVGRPTWVVPAIGGAALLLLIIGWWVIGLPTFPGAGRPSPNPTQLVVVVTQVVSDQGATEPEISLIPPPVEPQNDPSPTLTVLPTATPSPTATPPPALSNLLGGGTEIIAYAANDGDNYDIFVQPINGDIPTRLTTDRANDFGPVWSPDGREIAFHTFRDGNWEIYIMDTSGRSKRNLTRASGDDAFAAWAPDGQTLAFHSNRGGDFEIYLIGRDGSNLIQITDNEIDDFGPHWSPDGQKIAYHRRTTQGRQIFVMNRDGSGIQQLTTGPTEHIFPLWSPDGNFLLYQDVVDEDRSRLYLMNPDGSDPQPITPRHQPAFFPSWSPDGLWILYHALEDAGSNREIYMIARTGGEPQRITTTAAVERMPVWQPVER